MRADAAVAQAFRDEWAGVVATLARRIGDLDVAEEATQDAFVAAAERWPRDGVPPRPGAWLALTARRRAIDLLRARAAAGRTADAWGTLRRQEAADQAAADRLEAEDDDGAVVDDRLRLVFACCHPSLALAARVALTLRLVAGLTVAEIANAFLVPEATVAQRLVRAKAKIRAAGIPIAVPPRAALAERTDGVLAVVYLVFNEGYAASGDGAAVREDLCAEALRLGDLLAVLLPEEPEVLGLLALMRLHEARRPARTGPDGRPVPLAEQDRTLWDPAGIAEGLATLDRALDRRRPGPFQVQAAIAALHAQAPDVGATDWAQIAALYGVLGRWAPSPVVEVNRAVAVGMADGPAAGLSVLDAVLASGRLDGYAPLHAAHADLLARSGESAAARAAWARAAALTANPPRREGLMRLAGDG